jgi:hypothetical protein
LQSFDDDEVYDVEGKAWRASATARLRATAWWRLRCVLLGRRCEVEDWGAQCVLLGARCGGEAREGA